MKTFFAKYLPVEGELNKGDISFWDDSEGFLSEKFFTVTESVLAHAYAMRWKKYKLFLCSRDIQVGDTYHYSITEIDVCDSEIRLEQIKEQEKLHGQKRFKVIGVVSSDALSYVKDGDEFDAEQLLIDNSIVKIKYPCCPHFN